MIAHAGGMGWDELAVFVAPVVVLLALQIAGRRRARVAGDPHEDGNGHGNGDDKSDGHGEGEETA